MGSPDDAAAPEARAATLTTVLGMGAIADRGSVLYTADTEPVATLLAPEALYRELSIDSTDGNDVRALEENLAALGYGKNLTIDKHFDQATASAVKAWEEALKRKDPDGIVSVGEVVFLREPAAIISHRAVVGDKLSVGTPVLSLGTESRVISAMVDIADRKDWALNTVVQLDWTDEPGTGSVTEVGRDEVDGQLEVTISFSQAPPDLPTGTEVDVVVTTAERTGAVTVPVSAVIADGDGPAVRTVIRGGDTVTQVKLGIVAYGLAEITEGLQAGTKVRLPG